MDTANPHTACAFQSRRTIGFICWLLFIIQGLNPALVRGQFFGRPQPQDEVFMLAPRPLVRLLREGEQAILEKRYADAVLTLGAILDDNNPALPEDLRGQDFFIGEPDNDRYFRTIKGEARNLLGSLESDAREILEIEYGIAARKELTAALKDRDLQAVASIARKFPHTEAGYDAQVLLARQKWTQGSPLAAANLLSALLELPAARNRFGPELSRMAAICWTLADREMEAVKILVEAGNLFPGQSIVLAGKRMQLGIEADWLARLNLHIKDGETTSAAQLSENWLTSGGAPSRNAVSASSLPLPSARWDARTHGSLPERDALTALQFSEQQADRVLLPKFEARMLGDLILTKTTDSEVLAIDFESGLTKWPFYRNSLPTKLMQHQLDPRSNRRSAPSQQLKSRVWGSSAYGRFSCDSERLYYITEAEGQTRRGSRNGLAFWSPTNQLQAASITSEGKILWLHGGNNSKDELAGAFFLGPPLSYEGDLYSIVDMNGETRLVVMDPETGDVLWSQQLAHPRSQVSTSEMRITQALSPTIADGLVICPTGAGSIVAVDLLSRSLKWGVTYRIPTPSQSFSAGALESSYAPLRSQWHDDAMIVQDGLLAVSPVETSYFFIFNVLTGEQIVTQQRRMEGRYLAGMRDGKIYLVSKDDVACINIRENLVEWRTEFPGRSLLAGKGLWLKDRLMLPLTENLLVEYALDDGRMLGSVKLDRPVGNLFAHQGDLISLTATELSVFHTRDAISREIEDRLQDNENDVWAMNQKSQLMLAEGDLEGSFELLKQSYELAPENVDTKHFLVQSLLIGLESDFEKYEPAAMELQPLVEASPHRTRFLRCLANGSIRAGDHLTAFRNLIDIMQEQLRARRSLSANMSDQVSLTPTHRVAVKDWIATELARQYAIADPETRVVMDQEIQQELDAVDQLVLSQRLMKLRYFTWHPSAERELIATAILLGQQGQQIASEKILIPILYSPSEENREVARKLLAVRTQADKLQLGPRGPFYEPIYSPDTLDVKGLTEESNVPSEYMEPIQWNRGMVQAAVSRNPGVFMQGLRLPQIGNRFGRPEYNVRLSSRTVIITSSTGNVIARLEYGRASGDTQNNFDRAIAWGGLLLIETSSEVIGFDLYRGLEDERDAVLWRQSLRNPSANPQENMTMADIEEVRNNLGINLAVREIMNRPSMVGPLTPGGLVLQLGESLVCIDPYSGRKVWERTGYTGVLRLGCQDLELSVVQAGEGIIDYLDCRDGTPLRTQNLDPPSCDREASEQQSGGKWATWFTAGEMLVDLKRVASADPSAIQIVSPSTQDNMLRIWNAFTQKELVCRRMPRGTMAGKLEDRYVVFLEPTGTLHLFDLQTESYDSWEVESVDKLRKIHLMRFQNRLVVMTAAGSELRQQTQGERYVFCIDLEKRELAWDTCGMLRSAFVPETQPRNSPFMFAYQVPSMNANGGGDVSVALIDLRDGSIAYSGKLKVQNLGLSVMLLLPRSQQIAVVLGEKLIDFTIGDGSQPPQPVFDFGLSP